jgi:outer membrane protein TolC
MRHATLALLLLLITHGAHGQPASSDTLRLALQEAIQRAQTSSPSAEIARLQFEQSEWDFEAYQSQFMPSFSLNGSAPGLERSISDLVLDDGSVRYVEQSRLFSRASVAVEQPIPLTGGALFVTSGLSRVDQFGDRDFSQWQTTPVTIGLEQPLFQFNDLKWAQRLSPLTYRIARRTLTEDIADVAVDISQRFFDVYIEKMNVDIAQFNVAVNDTIYTLSEGRYEIGRIAENDLLQSELQLLNARVDLSAARIAYDEAREDLRRALDLPDDTAIDVIPPTAPPTLSIDPNAAVAQAERNRSDFLELQRETLAAQRDVALVQGQNGFSATISARYGLNQSATTLDQAYRDPLSQQRFGISFQMPLYQWGRSRAEVEAAEAAHQATREQVGRIREELKQDVYFEALRLQQLRDQVNIAATADTVASRRFEVARNRYRVGNISITDLFRAQTEKDAARRSYIQALRAFWTSYYQLRRLTLYDFGADRPLTYPME